MFIKQLTILYHPVENFPQFKSGLFYFFDLSQDSYRVLKKTTPFLRNGFLSFPS